MVTNDKDIPKRAYGELMYYLEREYRKLEIVFSKVHFIGNQKDVWILILSYWEDCKHFYNKNDYIKAFELVNYIWGMLDILANLDLLEIPRDVKKWFKIEQNN
ncbi:MAG TPA: DUF357 domain-containing protein [Candidatus Nanopusillus sp.]|nr:DUF357 domain-containing protein [Candidatus Nanopusillus sp.]HIP90580.1 DUF357 domain-containing protein [Candidatus Nanopusillus sp.]